MKRWLSALAAVLLLLAGAISAHAASRGLRVELRQSEATGAASAGSVQLYQKSYALVIGIDAYKGGWPRLSNAVRDAKAVAGVLRLRGFDVTLKTNLDATEPGRRKRLFSGVEQSCACKCQGGRT